MLTDIILAKSFCDMSLRKTDSFFNSVKIGPAAIIKICIQIARKQTVGIVVSTEWRSLVWLEGLTDLAQ